MADCEQVLQDRMAIYGAFRAFGVDTPPLIGDEGGETPLSEYSLHFEMSLVPREGWAGGKLSTLALGFVVSSGKPW